MADDLMQFALAEAQRQNVDPSLVQSIMQAESNGRAGLVSSAGARGPMQLMPDTARGLGVNIDDPHDNIRGGIRYLSQLSAQFGNDPRLVAAAYNAGPGALSRSLASTGDIPNFPETQAYVQKVTGSRMSNGINPDWLEPAAGGAAAGAVQGAQAAAGPQPTKIDPSWLETAAPASTSSAPASTPPPTDDSLWGRAKRVNAAIASAFPNPFSVLGIGPGGDNTGVGSLVNPQTNALGQKVANQNMLDPRISAAARGVLLPVNLIDKYAITPLVRKLPAALGGNPNEPTLDETIAANTRAPSGAIEQGETKAAGYVGNAVGAGKILKGAGALANIAGLSRIGSFLSNAGTMTPGTVGGAVTGGAAADVTDMAGQKLGLTPGARTAADVVAGIAGGWPGASLGNRLANGISPEVASTLNAARASNVPVQMSDVSPAWQSATRFAEKIPFGGATAGGVAAKQVSAVRTALANAAEKYRPNGLDDTAGAAGTDRFIANDLRQQYTTAKNAANDAYSNVQNVMDAHPELPPISLDSTKASLQQLQQEYPKALAGIQLSRGNRRVLSVLDDALKEPETTVNVGGAKIDLSTNPALRAQLEQAGVIPPAAPQFSLQDARKLSSALWNEVSRVQGTREMSAEQLGLLKKLAGSVGSDVDSYMASAPDDVRAAYANADQVFKSRVVPFREDPRVYKLVSSRSPASDYDLAAQGLYNNLFNTAQGERSAMALNLMSPNGQKAATYQALKDAGDKALSTASPNGLKVASGARALDIEGNPALANIAANSPAFADDAARLSSILQIGRQAATTVAGKGALTGFQSRHVGPAVAMYEAAKHMAEHFGPAIGYGAGLGAPVAAANIVTLLNRIGPDKLRLLLANPGTIGQRAAPGAVQGLLATPNDQR